MILPPSGAPALWRRLALLAGVLALEFVLLEVVMRAYGGSEAAPAFQKIFMQDSLVGHRLQPGARTRYSTVEFSTDLAINAHGVRDDEDIGPKAPGERRVVILGDSLVLSVQVPLAETFGELLERRLQDADPAHRWRVINAGVQGYGPVEDWLFYRHVADAFEPDVVLVVAFVANDAVEANDREAWIDADGRPATAVAEAAITWTRRLVRSSMVLQGARLRWDQLIARIKGPGIERPVTTYLTDPPPEVLHGLEVSRRAFGLIAARAAQRGARTALVLMPARFQVEDEDYGRLREIVKAGGGDLVRQAATERFREALRPLNLPMLDLLPPLVAEPDRAGLFFQRNVHLTPRGHRVVADVLLRFMKTQGLAGSGTTR